MIDILSRRLAIQASAAAGAAATQAANATSSAVAAATSSTGVVTALSCTASGATSASIAANYLAIVTTGFGSAGDGGHGMYKRVASQPPSLGRFRSSDRYLPNGTADNTNGGWWQLLPTNGEYNVMQFGATGNGTNDDTAAIQNAITVATANGGALRFPAGNYLISAALNIPYSNGWRISGSSRGATTITQNAGNTPIFTLSTTTLMWGWNIEDLNLTWATAQSSSNTNAVAIWMNSSTATGGGYFNWCVRRCTFGNGYRSISGPYSAQVPIWGSHISDCSFGGSMTGAAFYAQPNPAVGQPRIAFDNCMIDCSNAAESSILINAADTVSLTNIEILSGSSAYPQITISACSQVLILNCRSENYNWGSRSSGAIWSFPNSRVNIINCVLTGMLGTAGNPTAIQAGTGGALSIFGLSVNSSMSGGEVLPWTADTINFVTNFSFTGNVSDSIRTYLGSVQLPHIYADAQTVDSVTANGTSSVTLTSTSDRLQYFNQTLTANIQCTLPSTSTMKQGGYFEIVRRAATPGAFTLQVVDPSSGQNYTFAANNNGSVRYRFYGGAWMIVSVTN